MSGWMPRVNGYSPGSPRRSSRSGRDVVLGVGVLDLDAGVGEAARVVRADDRRDGGLVLGRGGHGREGYGAAAPARSIRRVEVTVRLFAMLRERAGRAEVVLELPEGARVSDALAAARRRWPTGCRW